MVHIENVAIGESAVWMNPPKPFGNDRFRDLVCLAAQNSLQAQNHAA